MSRLPPNFCTLFDHRYLGRALALHSSLLKQMPSAHLFCLPLDDKAAETLHALNLPQLHIISFEDFLEKTNLGTVKSTRPWNEFCFTCTPFLIDYCLSKWQMDFCTYLDADIFFFDSPETLLREMIENKDVLITEHDYAPGQDQTASSGRFCVQFVAFRNTTEGRKILERWKAQCFQSCAMDASKNMCGDQKYLDEWPEISSHVHVAKHRGAVGPWGLENFEIERTPQGKVQISENENLIFYHFHGLKIFSDLRCELTGSRYRISAAAFERIYQPYLKTLFEIRYRSSLKEIPGNFLSLCAPAALRHPLKDLWRRFAQRQKNYVFKIPKSLSLDAQDQGKKS